MTALIPQVRKKADVVPLLSSCGYLETIGLIKKVAGIDLAISSGRLASTIIKEDNPPVFQAGMKGQKMGAVTLTVAGKSRGVSCAHKLVELYGDVHSDPQVLKRIEEARAKVRSGSSAIEQARKRNAP